MCFLAYSNGANDNFKGVATLYGSQTTSYTTAIRWGTACTFLGSVCSLFFAYALLHSFSGKGLVPTDLVGSEAFLLAVAPNVPGFLAQAGFVDGESVAPFLKDLYTYAWFVGFFVAGGLYLLGMQLMPASRADATT